MRAPLHLEEGVAVGSSFSAVRAALGRGAARPDSDF